MTDELQAENARLKRELDRALALLAFAGGVASGYSRTIEQTDPRWSERWAIFGTRWAEAGGANYEEAPITEAAYREYMEELKSLAPLDPAIDSPEGLRLMWLSVRCEKYEAMQTLVDLNDE